MPFDNRFGMFIHWGIYAQTGLHEQAFARYDWPREKYEALARAFNPTAYDPEEWVLLAKKAGMQYICFTAKHHDGFCMWDTKETDYCVMNTPYGRDVLKMLAEACHRHGMRLSLYYSNPDWHHPLGYNPASTHQWKAVREGTPDTEGYRAYIRRQITELLTHYGEIYTLFWDIPPKIFDPSLNELARRLQPQIKINDRGFDAGDFSTPEREYQAPSGTRFTRMTEACNSLGQQSWGYREREDFYSYRHLTCAIDRIMAMGGNYLLNVGPDGLGRITPPYARRLERIGAWYCRVRRGLEGCDADPFDYGPNVNAYIATARAGKTYLHFYNGLISDAVSLRNYPGAPRTVTLLNTGERLPFAVEPLPEYFDGETGTCSRPSLHITGIPIDELNEAVALEIAW